MFFYVLNMHVNFHLNRILFTIQSINLFLYIIFYHKNLIFKHQLFDLQALFGFFFFITHHLSLNFHHSSLKIPQLPIQSLFGTITQLVITKIFQLFVGSTPVTWSEQSYQPTCPSFSLFSFPLPPLALSLSQSTNPNL